MTVDELVAMLEDFGGHMEVRLTDGDRTVFAHVDEVDTLVIPETGVLVVTLIAE